LVGELLFDLRWPRSSDVWLCFAGSLVLANFVSFGCRFLINLSAFWLTDAKGVGALVFTSISFLSGLVVPLRLLPEGIQAVALALPFAGILQTPADVFLERVMGAELVTAVALQAFWAMALLVLSQVTLLAATRRLVVQGG
ncbi:MAG TPA: ABC-2 family transporter protein, partial [Chloroflexota bacterium]|nr:ABC-2 family transporter protein [Chloroflexota bacterium]